MCLFSTNASVANTGCEDLVRGSCLAEEVALCVELGKHFSLRVLNSPVPPVPLAKG